MLLDRSPIRESGSSDSNRPSPAGDFDGNTRREAMKALLAKHDELDQVPVHAFWSKRLRRALKVMVLANVVWGTAMPANAQMRSNYAPLSPQEAADVMRRLVSPANIATRPAPLPASDGPYVFGTPGAASWLDFPPEPPRRRLDGTLLSDPPTVYGAAPYFVPVLTYPRPRK